MILAELVKINVKAMEMMSSYGIKIKDYQFKTKQ